MRVAITSVGPSLASAVDERFGRARYILIADTENGLIEAIDNSRNLHAAQGAGIQAAQAVADHRAEWVLTGHVGPKAYQALSAAGIQVASGAQSASTCADALERFTKGEFQTAVGADVTSHW